MGLCRPKAIIFDCVALLSFPHCVEIRHIPTFNLARDRPGLGNLFVRQASGRKLKVQNLCSEYSGLARRQEGEQGYIQGVRDLTGLD